MVELHHGQSRALARFGRFGEIRREKRSAPRWHGVARAVAHLSEGTSVTYGFTASDLGAEIYEAFRTLAAAGPIGERLTDAQKTALQDALVQIDTGSVGLRAANAENGRKQARVETLGERAEQRSLVLSDIIAANEDADLGQVAVALAQQKATLEASYSVFAQLSQLTLTKYL